MCKEELLRKIKDKTAIIGVVGLGYVGLPFAVEKAKVGFKVVGIEQNSERAKNVNEGINYIGDVDDNELKEVIDKGLITAVLNFNDVSEMDVIVICVPTPLTTNLTPEMKYIISVTEQISKHLRKGQLISLESTTYPGTTEEIMVPILEKNSGLKVEEDFFVAHSPERVDPGNLRYTTKNTNKVVGGVGPVSLEVAMKFYMQTILQMVPVSSAKAAELVKVFENTYRAVNIALVNELTLLCDRMGLNIWEVLDAAFTKPFGIQPFYPGPGVGGHCIPLDPHYLEWKAREYNFNTHFINLAGETNRKMPEFVRDKTCRVLNNLGIAISRAKILVLGVSYKANLNDWRESPAIDVIKLLQKSGANISYHDPYVSKFDDKYKGVALKGVELTDEAIKNADLVLITTNHENID
ncbi:MAG: nucleotide sugar dehydrogenase, partial [Planctomycetes bacterium]|nr:nucleotide sugar dehydrogenase [Planctomycetota bacterium]